MAEEKTIEEHLNAAILTGVAEGVKSKFSNSYGPAGKLIEEIIQEKSPELKDLLSHSIQSAITNPEFRKEVEAAVHANLAKALVRCFGGELEKAVNALKSKPETRVRITDAIEQIARTAAE